MTKGFFVDGKNVGWGKQVYKEGVFHEGKYLYGQYFGNGKIAIANNTY
jgi:hypothetical protein